MSRVLIYMLLICVAVSNVAKADFYVDSVNGSDGNPGTKLAPFGTMERARDAVRVVIGGGLPDGGVTVWIRGGLYERSSTFTLSAQDSGAAAPEGQ